MSMRMAGTICWFVEIAFMVWYLYTTYRKTNVKGVVLKTITALGIPAYGSVLMLMQSAQTGTPVSSGCKLFILALLFTSVGDIIFGILPVRRGGSIRDNYGTPTEHGGLVMQGLAGIAGIFFIVSYFLQMLVFLRNIGPDIRNYPVMFLMLFLMSGIIMTVVGLVTKFSLPDISLNLIIIGLFYMIIIAAVYATATVYAFWMFGRDSYHASFIFTAAFLFLLAGIVMALRYSGLTKYDTPVIRTGGRVLYYTSRMMLAGCAFLF